MHQTIHCFSQNNPKGAGQGDVPSLLRRVAETLDSAGPVTVQDLVFHDRLTESDGFWPFLTVYYYPGEPADDQTGSSGGGEQLRPIGSTGA